MPAWLAELSGERENSELTNHSIFSQCQPDIIDPSREGFGARSLLNVQCAPLHPPNKPHAFQAKREVGQKSSMSKCGRQWNGGIVPLNGFRQEISPRCERMTVSLWL